MQTENTGLQDVLAAERTHDFEAQYGFKPKPKGKRNGRGQFLFKLPLITIILIFFSFLKLIHNNIHFHSACQHFHSSIGIFIKT